MTQIISKAELMKKYCFLAGAAIIGAQLTASTARSQDTNTVEVIKQLQRRIEELEQKVKALEHPKASTDEDTAAKQTQHLEELDKKV